MKHTLLPLFILGILSLGISHQASAQSTVLSNGTSGNAGYLEVNFGNGGEITSATITAEGLASNSDITDQVVIDYKTFITAGGSVFELGNSTITSSINTPSQTNAVSSGFFIGTNGNRINWTADSVLTLGSDVVNTTYKFVAETGLLGDIKLEQYLDEAVVGAGNDVLFTRGTSAAGNLQLYTIDNNEVFGVSHGGALNTSKGLLNATYLGWTADRFNTLLGDINAGTAVNTLAGNINTNTLVPFNHPVIGASFGPTNITSSLGWEVDPNASAACIITTFGGLPEVDFLLPDLEVEKVADRFVTYVQANTFPINFDIFVSNKGVPASGITVVDTFDPQLFTNVTASAGGVVNIASGTVTWVVGNMPTNGFTNLTVTAFLHGPGIITNLPPSGITTNFVEVFDDGVNGADLNPLDNFDNVEFVVSLDEPPPNISGYVWHDIAGNADGDPFNDDLLTVGQSNVTMFLATAADPTNIFQTTVTGNNGFYAFKGLPNDTYVVTMDLSQLQAPYDTFSTTYPQFPPISNAQPLREVNYGLAPRKVDLKGRVWYDTFVTDGIPSNEPASEGILGATVVISTIDAMGNLVPYTNAVTDVNGDFCFIEINAEEFHLALDVTTLPPDVTIPTTPLTQIIDLRTGPTAGRGDFGWLRAPTADIKGSAWIDYVGGDGLKTNDLLFADGIGMVIVDLFTTAGAYIRSATTSTEVVSGMIDRGYYEFLYVPAGNYEVRLNLPSVPFQILTNTTPTNLTITLTDRVDQVVDFGLLPEENDISGTVWWDLVGLDGDPSNDLLAMEGILGATVNFYNIDNAGNQVFLFNLLTGPNGQYQTDPLPNRIYIVEVIQPGITTGNTTPLIYTNNLTMGSVVNDFGLIRSNTGTISGFVWQDFVGADGNFSNDTLAVDGLIGVDILLYASGASNLLSSTQITGTNGFYEFTNVIEGAYVVQIDVATVPVPVLNFTTPILYPIFVMPDDILFADFGLLPNTNTAVTGATITGTVWYDQVVIDGNPVNEPLGTLGVSGALVELYSLVPSNTLVMVTTTAPSIANGPLDLGFYEFTGLIPGTYEVVLNPTGLFFTSLSTPISQTFVITDISTNIANFGLVDATPPPGGRIQGNVWWDQIGQDGSPGNDPLAIEGISNAVVELFIRLPDGAIIPYQTTTSTVNGAYDFEAIPPGSYLVRINKSTLPDPSAQFTTADTYIIRIVQVGDILTRNFGVVRFADLSGSVWFDVNNDGVFGENAAQFGLNGVTVQVSQAGVIIASTNTQLNTISGANFGSYTFPDLPDGLYDVSILPASIPIPGAIPSTPWTVNNLTITMSQVVDFGVYNPAIGGGELTGFVFDDVNENGVLDENLGLTAIAGATVTLLREDPITGFGVPISSQVTPASGAYFFAGLMPGDYTVSIVLASLPTNSELTTPFEYEVAVTAESTSPQDFGVIEGEPDSGPPNPPGETNEPPAGVVATIAGVVWQDITVIDGDPSNENLANVGIPGISVSLFDTSNGSPTFLQTVVTGTGGSYQFANLAAGTYSVEVDSGTIGFAINSITTPTSYNVPVTESGVVNGQNFGFVPEPTAIELLAFSATANGETDTVSWRAADESETLGYIVKADGVQVGSMILATGKPLAEYSIEIPTGAKEYTLDNIRSDLQQLELGKAVTLPNLAEADTLVLVAESKLEAGYANVSVLVNGDCVLQIGSLYGPSSGTSLLYQGKALNTGDIEIVIGDVPNSDAVPTVNTAEISNGSL